MAGTAGQQQRPGQGQQTFHASDPQLTAETAIGGLDAAAAVAFPAGAHLLRLTVDAAHRLSGARWCPSPHCDDRPDPSDISLLVIHALSLPPGEFGGALHRGYIDDLFCGRLDTGAHPYFASLVGLRVSAHLCIFRDGSITQYVAFDRRAWHAGESNFGGRARCNDFSIGIELEGDDEHAFTDAQYTALIRAADAVRRTYPRITPARIVGHADIAPHRKTDPGPRFDWTRLAVGLEFPR